MKTAFLEAKLKVEVAVLDYMSTSDIADALTEALYHEVEDLYDRITMHECEVVDGNL
jgi:hypothetical protein